MATKKLLPLLVLAVLSAAANAATPPNTLVVAQGLDDIVSLDPAEANELSSIQTVPSLYQRLVQPDRDNPAKISPILAESWEANAAAKTLTIKLKPGCQIRLRQPAAPGRRYFLLHPRGDAEQVPGLYSQDPLGAH